MKDMTLSSFEWCEFSHPHQDPSSVVLDVLELLNALARDPDEECIAIFQPGGDKGVDQLFCICQTETVLKASETFSQVSLAEQESGVCSAHLPHRSNGPLPISQSELSVSSSAKVKLRSGHRLVSSCTAWRHLSDKLRTDHRKCELNVANAEATKVEFSNAMDLFCHTGSGKDHQSSSSTHPEVLPEEVEPSKEPSTKDGKEERRKAVTTRRHDDGAEDGALPHPSPTSSRPPQVLLHRKKAQRHDDDGSDGGDDESDGDEDGALPHPSPTSSHVQRRKQAQRHHDDDGSDGDDESDGDEDGALPHPSPTSSRVQRRKKARRHDDDDDDDDDEGSDGDDESDSDEDGALPHPSPTSSRVQRRKQAQRHDDEDGNKQPTNTTRQKSVKKTAAKRKYHVDADAADDDGERQNVSSRRPTVKRLKKTANKTQHNDDGVPKVRTRRRWSFEERTAVQRRMARFVALRKVPAKNDCLLCIEKESPVLSTRTWKDVKYCVYNEILKVEKMLGVYDSCFSSV
ncbi:protein starmaker-like [Epinephelus fuscoguttatus]|uniref:protein starmaker-like n=1 Tax=Epinephelus fuscoguttatus TaxID=293821 RepID=UPI0020D0AFFC|nr:protein starmaker-like [Epinephelus fuscoguttatus]